MTNLFPKTDGELIREGRERAARMGRSASAPADPNAPVPSSCGEIPDGGRRGQRIADRMGRSRSGGGDRA